MARDAEEHRENEEPRRSANGDATAAKAWNSERPRSERTAMLICIFGVLAYSVVVQMMSASTQVRRGVVAFMIYFPCFQPHSKANVMRLCAPTSSSVSMWSCQLTHIFPSSFLCSADEWSL